MDADWDLGIFSPPPDFGQAADQLELDSQLTHQPEPPQGSPPPNSTSNTETTAAISESPPHNHLDGAFAAAPRCRSMPAGDPSTNSESEMQSIFTWGDSLSFTILDKEDMATSSMPKSVQQMPTPQLDLPPPSGDLLENYIRQLSDLNLTLYRHSRSVAAAIACTPRIAAGAQPSSPMGILPANCSPSQAIPRPDGVARGGKFAIDETFRASQALIEILQQLRTKSTPAFCAPLTSPSLFQSPLNDPQTSQGPTAHPYRRPSISSIFSTSSTSTDDSSSDEPPSSSSTLLDSATLLLVLTCYIRLLQIYDAIFILLHDYISEPQLSFSDLQLPILNIGSFCPSSCPTLQILLLVQIVAHMLDRTSRAIQFISLSPDHGFGSRDGNTGGIGSGGRRLSNDMTEPVLKQIRDQEVNLKKNMRKVKISLQGSAAI
ncbi:hypothetical protein GP486_004756 [Trichoglossum hirsutum]|uniref:Uncharacterized protein n=1 Tax=Trichoglossum hirsutum TaxID=265104 RepID=A0A9P8LAG4_9PEZI|nr:hypothetical protein GP486_004756 [Trichoglossum hirsutum]